MSRSAVLVFACLAAFLTLLPLTLKKPGLPMQLSGDEATQFLMATSLGGDRDLRCSARDLDRLFQEFPFAAEIKLDLMSDDGWQVAQFAQPVLYPLLAAPFAVLWGSNGLLMFNALLFLATVGLAWRRLSQFNARGLALLYTVGFFVFSATFAYVFRMQSQVFTMTAVTLSLCLAWRDDRSPNREAARLDRSLLWVGLSGVALGLAVVQDPSLAFLALPLIVGLLRLQPLGGQKVGPAVGWVAGFAASLIAVYLLSLALTGHDWPPSTESSAAHNSGLERASFRVSTPHEIPWRRTAASTEMQPTIPASPTKFHRSIIDSLEDTLFFLTGRRTGLLPYFPFLLPLLMIFLVKRERSRQQWSLLAALSAWALLLIVTQPVSEGLYDQQIGNPHVIGISPAFLFLLTRLPSGLTTFSYVLGTIVTGTLVLTPLGAGIPGAPTHPHTRNFPFNRLPFEYPILPAATDFRQVPLYGLESSVQNDGASPTAHLWVPSDQGKLIGDEVWLLGGEKSDLWITSRTKLPPIVLNLRNLASNNRIELSLGGDKQERRFDDVPDHGVTFQLEMKPRQPSRTRNDDEGPLYFYRLRAASRLGERPRWRREVLSDEYLGLALTLLGSRSFIDEDRFGLDWSSCAAPPKVAPREDFLAAVRVLNRSSYPWPNLGPAKVRLSYHWLDTEGQEVTFNGQRTELSSAVAAGEQLASWVSAQAPSEPGNYLLEIDPVLENVAWFSARNDHETCRVEIEVMPEP